METINIQTKIEKLYNTIRELRHIGDEVGYTYVDDLVQLNKEIHDQIDGLYHLQGDTDEQEAALCLVILIGYSVLMYTNSDEAKKRRALERSSRLLDRLPSSLLKNRLSTLCTTLTNNYI